ncbi:hypothetical protein EK21DRAFT_54040 [Setomelanomma holmii]|uniref:J domain-containing protein n=1 Tax=Setomelanomma holmii TaxID=210430 RepID=A0A9P4HMD7_9PLEO|nr:hypothetical protein EK21DRAFT_54040 [Setomelanomma holmii]
MSTSMQNHYDILGVSRNASTLDIKGAYSRILQSNHPERTGLHGPSAKTQADKLIRAANAAWAVLSNPITKEMYDRTLPPKMPWSQYATSPSGGLGARPPSPSKARADEPRLTDNHSHSEVKGKEAEFRTMKTSAGTLVNIKISNWRLDILFSKKFRFINDVSELSDPTKTSDIVSFEIGLERDKNANEVCDPTINELTIKVQEVPGKLHISNIQTIFRELSARTTSLIITLTATNMPWLIQRTLPWEFGFEFDMNNQFATINRQRATCMIFSVEEPPLEVQTGRGIGTPEHVLKEDELKANAWCVLGDDRLCTVMYGSGRVEMWGLVAVGYRKGARLGAFV